MWEDRDVATNSPRAITVAFVILASDPLPLDSSSPKTEFQRFPLVVVVDVRVGVPGQQCVI